MITECPSCESTDLNIEEGFCRKCLQPLDDRHAAGPPPAGTSAAPEESAVMLRRLESASQNLDDAQTETEKDLAGNEFANRIFDYHERGYKFVTLIGFSEAGKTFFANRLRHELRMTKGWTVVPREKPTIEKTAQTIDWTQLVHHDKHRRLRILADCDGEAYRYSIDQLLLDQPVGWQLRRYVLITTLASAYILMVRAEDFLTPRSDDDLVERFDVIVSAILALQRSLRETGDARKVVSQGLDSRFIQEALQYELRCDRPIHVLFAQADNLENVERHEGDPFLFAMNHAKSLYRTIDNHFTNYRFDFVSAFAGHPAETKQADYNLPHYGALSAFDWVDAMIEKPRLWNLRTSAAIMARRILDERFRDARRIAGQ
jgi:hypothetical protein